MFSLCSNRGMAHRDLVYIYCECGHSSLVEIPRKMLRYSILPKARCTVCGERRAKNIIVAPHDSRTQAELLLDLERENEARAKRWPWGS